MADYNSDRTGSNIDLTLDKVDALDAKVQPTGTGIDVTGTVTADGAVLDGATGLVLETGTTEEASWTHVAATGESTINVGRNSTWGGDLNINTDTKRRMRIDKDGDVFLYEDTGTTAKFAWDASAESLRIGTSASASGAIKQNFFEVGGKYSNNNNDDNQYQTIGFVGTTGFGVSDIFNDISGEKAKNFYMGLITDDAYFNVNRFGIVQGGVERLTIEGYGTNAGNVGIGTASPERPLHIASATPYIVFEETDASQKFSLGSGGGKFFLYDETDSAQRLTVDSSGNVGIGTASPSEKLDVRGAVNGTHAIFTGQAGRGLVIGTQNTLNNDDGVSYDAQTSSGKHLFKTNGAERMRIDSSGNVGIGTASPSEPLDVAGGKIRIGNTKIGHSGSGGSWGMVFETYSGGYFERARIDSSGNLLVGTTDSDLGYTDGDTGISASPVGMLQIARDSSLGYPLLYLNRLNHDGKHIEFWKDGVTVGSIGTGGADLGIGAGTGNLGFFDATIVPMSNTSGGGSDGIINLGNTGRTFKDLYLSGGVYLGGTGAANKLDDYEEGTWTPAVGAGNISGTSIAYLGKYTKVGRLVTLYFRAYSASNNLNVASYQLFSGLPFAVDSMTGTGTVITEDIDQFDRQGFASVGGTSFAISNSGSSSGTTTLEATVSYYTA